jgi:hypothetical protein
VLLRNDDRGVLLIGQPAHAWISGQLARAWGNERFGVLEPFEEVCLGAEQHDVGMAEWDLTPTRNPGTGLPHSFIEMPLHVHLELWSSGPPRLLSQSRYAALLASMHGTRLYEMRDLDALARPDADAIREFLRRQRELQERLLSSLRADPSSADGATAELVARNSQLIWTWDYLSLAVCLDWAPCSAREVPSAETAVDVSLSPGASPRQLILEPWPFAAETVTLRCEGRRLRSRFETDDELAGALALATWETLEFKLCPPQP